MKQFNDPFERLFKAAAQAPVDATAEMRLGFATRVVAARGLELEEVFPWKTMLRGALVCSTLVMLLSLAANFRFFQTESPDELTLADAVIRTTINP